METPTSQEAKGTWKQFKGKLKEAWGVLTDDTLDRYEGKREQLEGLLEEKTGETRKEIRRKLDEIEREVKYRL